jgi:Flp pilus assembly protein TadB
MHWDGEGQSGPRIAPVGRGSRAPGLEGSQRPGAEPVSLASVRARRALSGRNPSLHVSDSLTGALPSRTAAPRHASMASRWLQSRIRAAQQELAVADIATAMGVTGLVAFSLVYLLTLSAPIAAVAGLAAFVLPILWLERCRAGLRSRFSDQLPDAVATVAALVRSGKTLRQALLRVGAEASEPIASAFLEAARQPERDFPRLAVRRLRDQYPGEDVELLAAALSIHAQTNASLPELLERLAHALRARRREGSAPGRERVARHALVAIAGAGTACVLLLASALPGGFDRYAWVAMVLACSIAAALLIRHVGPSDA